MKKIGDVTNTADKNGEFTNGNIATGTPPTILEGPWLTAIQREILNVLVKAGVAQDPNKDNQLAMSIEKIARSSIPEITQKTGDSETSIMSQKAVTDAISDSQVNVPNASESIMGKVKISSNPENKSTETAASTELLQKTNQSTNAIINKQHVTTTVPPELPSIDNTSLKLFIKNLGINTLSDFYVVSKKANGSFGYVAMGITKIAANPDDANTGGNSPIRPSEVLSLSEVYVGYFTPERTIGDVTLTNFVPETLRKMYGINSLLRPERLMIYNKGAGGN